MHPWDVSPADRADSYVRIADSSLDFRIGKYCGALHGTISRTVSPRRTSPGVAATGAEHLDGGAVSSQFRDRLETGGSRRPALEPVSVNAVGAGSGWHGRYPPGRKAICIPGRPRLEEHGGMGARPKGVRFLCAVAARAEWI